MNDTYDLAILGSGFAGSLLAMIARRLGRSVVLIERGSHPRVVIGESSTPLSNLLLEELATRYNLPALLPLVKWGTWQSHYPGIACGLKRGFSFFHHEAGDTNGISLDKQMLVAASPHDAIADTHWYRADLDHFLVREAERLGAVYCDNVHLDRFASTDDSVELSGTWHGEHIAVSARFIIDATGPRGALHRLLEISERKLLAMPATQALYSHFTGVDRLNLPIDSHRVPPYPVEAAAVHHVFDGGWIWVLRFNNGVTSAGVVATDRVAERFNFAEGAPAWQRVLDQFPAVRKQFSRAMPTQPFTYLPQLAFRSGAITGPRWALLPSAAGFVDPLLSSGLPLTLLGIERLAVIVQRHWEMPSFASELLAYAASTDEELLATSRLIGALYANMANFEAFRAISLIYFAAASYSETARRLGKPGLSKSFLLHNEPRFGPAAQSLLAQASRCVFRMDTDAFVQDVRRGIELFDVAGLCKSPRNQWYPANAEDLRQNAWKLGATRAEVDTMLDRCGFHLTSSSPAKSQQLPRVCTSHEVLNASRAQTQSASTPPLHCPRAE